MRDIATTLAFVWIIALGVGPVVACSRSWWDVLRNNPILFTIRLPLCCWDFVPTMRQGYFRWVLPPLLVIEFEVIPNK